MAVFPIRIQGTLDAQEKLIYTPSLNRTAKITLISYAPTADIDYTIKLFRRANGNKMLRYSFALEAGDTVDDESLYELANGDALFAIGSNGMINFIINGEETEP